MRGGSDLANQNIVFAGDKVALIGRGKTSAEHSPGKLEQHADCVRSNGSPVGYFGEAGEGSGYTISAVLIGIRGEVYDLDGFKRSRPYYVDATIARLRCRLDRPRGSRIEFTGRALRRLLEPSDRRPRHVPPARQELLHSRLGRLSPR